MWPKIPPLPSAYWILRFNYSTNFKNAIINFAANFNTTTLNAITTPTILAEAGYTIFDRQEQGLITNSRPKSKIILGLNYTNSLWDISLNNSRFEGVYGLEIVF